MSESHAPEGYASVNPYLIVEDVEALLDFLCEAFDAEETLRIPGPDGEVQHPEVRIGDSVVMMGRQPDDEPEFRASLYLYVEDCDEAHARAIDAGATAHREPTDQFYGDRSASVYAPCGTHFGLATRQETLSREELMERLSGGAG